MCDACKCNQMGFCNFKQHYRKEYEFKIGENIKRCGGIRCNMKYLHIKKKLKGKISQKYLNFHNKR